MQQPLELILMRELAGHLGTPIFVVDPQGELIYYNEPAELIVGTRFDETGPIPAGEWTTMFTPTNEHGEPMPPEDLPLVIALEHRRPAHARLWIRALDGNARLLEATAIPLVGLDDEHLGAAALFWEVDA